MLPWILLASLLIIPQAGNADFQPVANVNEIMTALVIPSPNVVENVGFDGDLGCLRSSDLSSAGARHRIVRHVLRLEGSDPEATAI